MLEAKRIVCGRCRGLNRPEAAECAHCHQPLVDESHKDERDKAKIVNPGQKRCTGCGKWSPAQTVYCPDCGVKLPPRAIHLDDGEAAGFWPRFAAFAIDAVVLVVLRQLVLSRLHHRAFDWEDLVDWRQAFLGAQSPETADVLSYFAVDAGYFTLLVGAWGRTLGKWLLGLKVTREGGAPVGFGLAFMRYLAHFFSLVPLGAGYVYIALNPSRRAFHDLLCQTRVIFASRGSGAP